MSRWPGNSPSPTDRYGFEENGNGTRRPVIIDFRTPATELEASEEPEPEDTLPYELIRMFRWLFENCVLRVDGKLYTAEGIAMRMCCLASLLRLPPVDAMPFEQIANHCGVTRAAVSKAMLELTTITGIRSCHQRSDEVRVVYRKRAIEVHARRKMGSDCYDS